MGLGCGADSEDEALLGGPGSEFAAQLAEEPSAGSDASASSGSCGGGAYRPCDADYERCAGLGPNTNCSSYTLDPESSFCAPYCTSDEACPSVPGFKAACNFAWCTLLCEQGSCPNGMVCLPGIAFIDTQGRERGARDVCVTAPP